MSSKKLGRATIKINGAALESYPGASCSIGGVTRKARETHNAVGFSEEYKAGTLECDINLDSTVSLDALRKVEDATVLFVTDIGKTYVGNHWFVTEALSFTDGGDSKVKVKLSGPAMVEI